MPLTEDEKAELRAAKPENVIAFARSCKQSIPAALVAAGLLSPAEAGVTITAPAPPSELDDADILKEVARRMARGEERESTKKIPGPDSPSDDNVTQGPWRQAAARKGKRMDDGGDGES